MIVGFEKLLNKKSNYPNVITLHVAFIDHHVKPYIFLMGHSRPLFFIFIFSGYQLTDIHQKFLIADIGIRTADLWCPIDRSAIHDPFLF